MSSIMTSLAQCIACPVGTYCGLGSSTPTPCPLATFSTWAQSARCTECPPGTTTVNTSTASLEGCVCKIDQFDRDPGTNMTECVPCPYASTDCKAVGAGVTLETLPLKNGYWRSWQHSESLRQCYQADLCEGGSSCGAGNLCDGYCAENHVGPFCELCVENFVKASDGSCTKCKGSIVLSFLFPGLVVLGLVAAAIFAFRTGLLQAAADTAFEKSRDESVIMDAVSLAGVVQEAARDTVIDELSGIALDVIKDAAPALADAGEQSRLEWARAQWVATAGAVTETPGSSPPPSPPLPPSPPAPRKLQQMRSSSIASIKVAAVRVGYAKERIMSWQVKIRILISLVQVLSALGVVFSIPYPPFYDSVVAYLGVFSLDLFTVMPLGCTVKLNHDHYLLMRTLLPLVLLCISFSYRQHLVGAAARRSSRGEHAKATVNYLGFKQKP